MNPQFMQRIFVFLPYEYFYEVAVFFFYIYIGVPYIFAFFGVFDLNGRLLPSSKNTQKVNKTKNSLQKIEIRIGCWYEVNEISV
jgi:hypothetical protein